MPQNAHFVGHAPIDEEDPHPPGGSITRLLQKELTERGWKIFGLDIWRDCGWTLRCRRQGAEHEVLVASVGDGSAWILSVYPFYVPGIMGLWKKKRASATPADVFTLSKDVHAILVSRPEFRYFEWCWDDDPRTCKTSTPEPSPP
jgi:hypothetical protein